MNNLLLLKRGIMERMQVEDARASGYIDIMRFQSGFIIIAGHVTLIQDGTPYLECTIRLPSDIKLRRRVSGQIPQINVNSSQILKLGIDAWIAGNSVIRINGMKYDESNITANASAHFIFFAQSRN